MTKEEIVSFLEGLLSSYGNAYRELNRAYYSAKYGDLNTAHAALMKIDHVTDIRKIQTAIYYIRALEYRKEQDND